MKNKTSIFSLFTKGLKISLINIWRNKALSIASIFVIGTIIFIFNIILTINFITNEALSDLNKKVDLIVYLKESTDYSQAQDLIDKIKTQDGVEDAIYTSKENALKQLKTTHPNLALAFEKYNLDNPLPASINIKTLHPQYHEEISNFLNQEKQLKYISNQLSDQNTEQNNIISSVSKNLYKLNNFANQIIFWLVITFIIGGTLIMLNALHITIFNRKTEISIMKLVGASHWFIKLPFILESIIYGILAIILSFIMLSVLSKKIQIQESSIWTYYKNIEFYSIFFLELTFTVIISIISSIIAVHDHLRANFK